MQTTNVNYHNNPLLITVDEEHHQIKITLPAQDLTITVHFHQAINLFEQFHAAEDAWLASEQAKYLQMGVIERIMATRRSGDPLPQDVPYPTAYEIYKSAYLNLTTGHLSPEAFEAAERQIIKSRAPHSPDPLPLGESSTNQTNKKPHSPG